MEGFCSDVSEGKVHTLKAFLFSLSSSACPTGRYTWKRCGALRSGPASFGNVDNMGLTDINEPVNVGH